jgi:hypothetical protein
MVILCQGGKNMSYSQDLADEGERIANEPEEDHAADDETCGGFSYTEDENGNVVVDEPDEPDYDEPDEDDDEDDD